MKNRIWFCQMAVFSALGCLAVSQPVAAEDETFYLGSVLEIENKTEEKATGIYIKSASEEDWAENRLEVRSRFEAEEDTIYDLKLVTEDEKSLYFYNLPLAEIKTLTLFSEEARTYVRYEDLDSGEEVDTQDYALAALEEPLTLYTKDYLNVRAIPQVDAEVYEVLSPATETQACAEADGWYLIRHQDGYGYVSADYVTDSKEEAEKLAWEREQARAAQSAAADQTKSSPKKEKKQKKNTSQSSESQNKPSQADPSQSDESQPGVQPESSQPAEAQPQPSQPYEVSRENVASCEDPDHGTTYITYSDGSVQTIDY